MLLTIGWKRAVLPVLAMVDGVPLGVEGPPPRIPENIMFISEGEGEGAREETTLDTSEELISQFWIISSSSCWLGPPSLLVSSVRGKNHST